MNPNRLLWLVSLAFVFASTALAQDGVMLPQDGVDTVDGNTADSGIIARPPVQPLLFDDQPAQQEKPYPWSIAVYPALAWVPLFGAGIDIPPTPSNPIANNGTTTNSFNGAYFGGARIEKGKWSGDLLIMWAALSANRTTPRTDVGFDFVFGDAMVGYEVLPGLYAEAGFRRLALDLHATVDTSTASVNPGYWDPLLGVTYSHHFGKKWRVVAHADGGGFGAGSDVDVTVTGRGEWQFARHYGMTFGYGLLHLSDSTQFGEGTLHFRPTLNGPIIGFGLYF